MQFKAVPWSQSWIFIDSLPPLRAHTHTHTHWNTHPLSVFYQHMQIFQRSDTHCRCKDYFQTFLVLFFCLFFVQIDLNWLLRQRGGTELSQIQANKQDSDTHLRLMASSATIIPSPVPVWLGRRSTWTTPTPVFNHRFCCAVRTRCCSNCPVGTPVSTAALCGWTFFSLKLPRHNFWHFFPLA